MNFDKRCSQEQFESLHTALDKTRSTSATVRVDKQALINLLIDHSALHRCLTDQPAIIPQAKGADS